MIIFKCSPFIIEAYMLSKKELRYMLALQRVPNLGDISAKKLLHHIGSAEGIFKEKKGNLLKIDGIGLLKLKGLSEIYLLDAADEELAFLETNQIAHSYFQEKNYPENLKHCLDGPILFFQKGNIDFVNKKIISIVGTRNITPYGLKLCEKIIQDLTPISPVIVSGFAYGVDITAHKAAMNHGMQTIVCLAHGLNQIYPRQHKKYVDSVEENGGFITEFWSDDAFDRNNFLKRNRIIAGLSEATIVIESAERGGSLVTADIANSYNREVFALPGKVGERQSEGCNNLIKSQQARMITHAADIIYMLGWSIDEEKKQTHQVKLFEDISPEEMPVYQFLKENDKELLDTIAVSCEMPSYKVAAILMKLELKGIVRPLPGKLFELN